MKAVESPSEFDGGGLSLFLAGGITDCPDWQAEVLDVLASAGPDVTALNPRRKDFPVGDPAAGQAQTAWEYRHLRKADAILFWFPRETLCPIVLYELGAWSMTRKPLFVATHPDYARRLDVVMQTALARPDVVVGWSVATLVDRVLAWAGGRS